MGRAGGHCRALYAAEVSEDSGSMLVFGRGEQGGVWASWLRILGFRVGLQSVSLQRRL